ncbi:MAG: VOC family virulence protein, partial [Polynucleobacter sp. 24-46-87]
GQLKINLQDKNTQTPTKARVPTIGSGDFCLISAIPLDDFIAHLSKQGVAIDVGPVPRRGALGPIRSVYLRDPDQNLVEVAEYV